MTVLAGSGQPTDRWARLAVQAAAAVGRRLPAGVADRWDGRVVVEVPATVAHFAAVLGQSAEAYAGIAAVAYQAGVGEAAPLRIVVNPRARTVVDQEQLAEILRHEITHLATRSPESAAPLWAVEGLAEWVAVGGQPGRSSSGTADLLAEVRAERPAPIPAGRCRLRRHLSQPEPRLRRGLAGLSAMSPIATLPPGSAGSTPSSTAAARVDQASRAVLGIGADRAHRRLAPTSGPARRGRLTVPRTLVVTNDFPPRIGGIESFVRDVCALLDHDVVVYASGPPGASATDADRGYPVVRAGPLLLPTRQVAAEVTDLALRYGATRVVFGAAAPLGLLAPQLRRPGCGGSSA